jgi:UDP-N-acetylmuramate dehydrogenase
MLGEHDVQWEDNKPMALLTTYAVGGMARIAVTVRTYDDMQKLAAALSVCGDIPLVVLGRGSNTLFSDSGFNGVVVIVGTSDESKSIQCTGDVVSAAGSMLMPVLARRSVQAARGGLEWCVGIPGTVGGAVRMNAGGHGSDMASSLTSVRMFHLRKGLEAHVNAVDLGLRFRGSALDDHHVVLSATVDLEWSKSQEASEAELQEVVRWRRENQPGGQNAGSVFVNPEPGKVSAGAVIDELGMRGLRVGSAQVSEKHANFIQADEHGSAHDVVALMAEIRRRVRDERGYLLRSEIRLVGF